jgi:uncharacterized protein (DUF362 family)
MSTVSITKCTNIEDVVSLKKSLSDSIELLGGFKSRILKGDSVLIKPNILVPISYKTGAITNPFLIEALIDLLRAEGVKKITIGEGSVVGIKTDESFTESGWDKLAERKEVKLIDFKKEKFIPMSVPNGKILKFIYVPESLLVSDIVINVPVMKTHDTYPATLGLKNMKGIVREKDKKRYHLWGLSQCIVDLNKLLQPHITIEDGTIGMEGYGPVYGTPANLGVIISSFDVVAADCIAAEVMDIRPDTIEYLKLAIEQGLGNGNISDIEIKGLQVKDVRKKFSAASLEEEELKKYNIQILEDGACSGCRTTLEAFIYRMQNDKLLSNIKDHTFVLGQNVNVPGNLKGTIVKFGACTKTLDIETNNQELYYVQGCPPHPETTSDYIKTGKLY